MPRCSISLVGFKQLGTSAELRLESTSQLNGNAWVAPIEAIGSTASRIRGERGRKLLNFDLTWSSKGGFVQVGSGLIELSNGPEPVDREYLVFIELECGFTRCGQGHYIQFVRQSESYLQQQYSFLKPGGYWICGPRNVDFAVGNQIVSRSRRSFNTKGASAVLGARGGQHIDFDLTDIPSQGRGELSELLEVVGFLWSLELPTGPTNLDSGYWERQTLESKILILQNESFAVQCSGFRDLFVSIALARGFKVRCVEAFSSPPVLADLIPFGHSTAEVWLPSMKQWCLFDPWFGGLIPLLDGAPLSVRSFPLSNEEKRNVSLVRPTRGLVRKNRTANGGEQHRRIDLTRIPVAGFSTSATEGTNVQPGFLDYFQYVEVRDCVNSTILPASALLISWLRWFWRLSGRPRLS